MMSFALCNLVEIAIVSFFSQVRQWKEPDKAKHNTLGSDKSLASSTTEGTVNVRPVRDTPSIPTHIISDNACT